MLYNPDWKETEQTVELDEIGQGLLRAVDFIEKRGWCQNVTVNEIGNVCLWGAIRHANISWTCDEKSEALDRVRYKVNLNDPINWNDTEGRTKDEVVSALKLAAYSK